MDDQMFRAPQLSADYSLPNLKFGKVDVGRWVAGGSGAQD